jgi:Rieske Fe-S protein
MAAVTRRKFIKAAALLGCCACIPLRGLAYGDLDGELVVGTLEDYRDEGVWDTFAKDGVLIVNREGKISALSNVCTHWGGQVVGGGSGLVCTRHKGMYDLHGVPTGGPPHQPLPRFAIHLNSDSKIVVVRSLVFRGDRIGDPQANLQVPR